VLAAAVAEFLEFQPLRRRLAVLGRRVIPLFAIAALQCHILSGHKNSSWILAVSFEPSALSQNFVILSETLSVSRRTYATCFHPPPASLSLKADR
jgi:hypothetical protein